MGVQKDIAKAKKDLEAVKKLIEDTKPIAAKNCVGNNQ